jgi:hypothetical protein
VSAELRYRLLLAVRSRAAIAPGVAWLFVLIGVYAYHPNDVRGSMGITALLLCPIAAWLAIALTHAEPAAQRELLTAGDDPIHALARTAAAFAVLGTALGAVDIAWPLVSHAFDRPFTASDLAAGALAHTGCAVYGAALGTLTGARLVARPAVAFAVLAAAAIVAVPLFELAPALSPAAWTADTMLAEHAMVLPFAALAIHALALTALAATALKRIP